MTSSTQELFTEKYKYYKTETSSRFDYTLEEVKKNNESPKKDYFIHHPLGITSQLARISLDPFTGKSSTLMFNKLDAEGNVPKEIINIMGDFEDIARILYKKNGSFVRTMKEAHHTWSSAANHVKDMRDGEMNDSLELLRTHLSEVKADDALLRALVNEFIAMAKTSFSVFDSSNYDPFNNIMAIAHNQLKNLDKVRSLLLPVVPFHGKVLNTKTAKKDLVANLMALREGSVPINHELDIAVEALSRGSVDSCTLFTNFSNVFMEETDGTCESCLELIKNDPQPTGALNRMTRTSVHNASFKIERICKGLCRETRINLIESIKKSCKGEPLMPDEHMATICKCQPLVCLDCLLLFIENREKQTSEYHCGLCNGIFCLEDVTICQVTKPSGNARRIEKRKRSETEEDEEVPRTPTDSNFNYNKKLAVSPLYSEQVVEEGHVEDEENDIEETQEVFNSD
jgi:hypothetical protein